MDWDRSADGTPRRNDQGYPAAAKNLCYLKTPDPPLGLTALFADYLPAGGNFGSGRFASAFFNSSSVIAGENRTE